MNDRFEVEDAEFVGKLWGVGGLRELVTSGEGEGAMGKWGGEVCGLNPRVRIYRYGKGQFFGRHCRCLFCTLMQCPLSPSYYYAHVQVRGFFCRGETLGKGAMPL